MFRRLHENPISVIESPNLVFLQSLTYLTLDWDSFQCRPQPPTQGWATFSLTESLAVQSLPNCTGSHHPLQTPLITTMASPTTRESDITSKTNKPITTVQPVVAQYESTSTVRLGVASPTPSLNVNENKDDEPANVAQHRVSVSIRANCMSLLDDDGICAFQQYDDASAVTDLVLQPNVHHQTPDSTTDTITERHQLVYH